MTNGWAQAAAEGLPVALMLTKLDRLITELKLPPNDAYHKLRHTIEEVNTLILQYGGPDALQVHIAAAQCSMRTCASNLLAKRQ